MTWVSALHSYSLYIHLCNQNVVYNVEISALGDIDIIFFYKDSHINIYVPYLRDVSNEQECDRRRTYLQIFHLRMILILIELW